MPENQLKEISLADLRPMGNSGFCIVDARIVAIRINNKGDIRREGSAMAKYLLIKSNTLISPDRCVRPIFY